MSIDSIFGVPAHPLFVHIPVVLTPLALVAALFTLKERWRPWLVWVTVGLGTVAALGAQFAVMSGEELEESVAESKALEAHADLGESTRTLIVIFVAVAIGFALYERFRVSRPAVNASKQIAAALMAATIVLGIVSTVWVARTGHQGAKITWRDVKLEGGEHSEPDED